MKKKVILGLISLLCVGSTCLTSCMKDGVDGKDGINGVDGSAGKDGENGKDGVDGKDGKDGTVIHTGVGSPLSETGKIGDLYIDTESGDMYSKGESGWIKTGNIKGAKGDDGTNGKDGVSIKGVSKTSSAGNVDIYTITYSDGSTSSFTVTNGSDGQPGATGQKGDDGHTPTVTIGTNGNWYVDGQDTGYAAQGPKGDVGAKGDKGDDGKDGNTPYIGSNGHWWIGDLDTGVSAKGDAGANGTDGVSIVSVVKTDSTGVIDTYTIYYSDNTTSTFNVHNGTDGKDGQDGHTPVVTIGSDGYWYVDDVSTGVKAKGDKGDTGNGISKVSKTSSEGNVDIYTITYSDGSTSTFTVTNGTDGKTPYIGENGHWWIGDTDTGVNAKGDKGDTGATGAKGDKGDEGAKGDKGDTGATGEKGDKGDDGKTPYIGENGHWWIGDTDTGVNAKGETGGEKGDTGVSVVDTYIDENGDLICKMSDGTTINAGHVKDVTKHTVSFYFDDDLVYKTTVEHGAKVAEPDETCFIGYTASSWSSKSDGGFKWLFSVYPVTSDLNLYADDWSAKSCLITLDPDQGTLENTTLSVSYHAQYELPTPTRENYTFIGWYDTSNKKVSSKATWKGLEDVTYTAKWTSVLNTYTLDAGDGACYVDTMVISYDGRYVLPTPIAPSSEGTEGLTYYYNFDGWYLNGKKISQVEKEWTYSKTGGILFAKYTKTDCIKYGLYPQSHVSDENLISALDTLTTPEINGWYLYDGSYYAKTSAKPYGSYSFYKFDDGTTIVEGTTYWFKCEPITWKILSSENGTYSLVSTELLDAQCFYSSEDNRTIDGKTVYPNNYKYSDIRTWLNGTFYNTAFSSDDSKIQTIEVDNSSATISSDNPYGCENTYDKVYLLSYQDYVKNKTYFADYDSKICKATDWAKANGASISSINNGSYWTRSPYYDDKISTDYVESDGYLNGDDACVDDTDLCVRPAITIKL